VQDLALIRLTVTEHQAEVKCCPQRETINRGEFPAQVNSVVQYKPEGIDGVLARLPVVAVGTGGAIVHGCAGM
jgi:transposase